MLYYIVKYGLRLVYYLWNVFVMVLFCGILYYVYLMIAMG